MAKDALVSVGSQFMVSPEIRAAGEAIGMPGSALYFRGRVAALGEVNAVAAAEIMGIFQPSLIEHLWRKTAGISAAEALSAYLGVCSAWGRSHLAGLSDPERLVELAGRVVDQTGISALALFGAWRRVERPEDPLAAAAFLLMLLRELRGGLHFAALAVQGLEIPWAMIADPALSSPKHFESLGWREADIEAANREAAAVPQLAERWAAAEELTVAAFRKRLSVLDDAEQAELTRLIAESDQLSSPHSA